MANERSPRRVFLLSPANCGGERMGLLLRPQASFELALRLRSPEGAPLGELFRFASGLYFRGKLAYAQAFGKPPRGVSGALVIAPGAGLVAAEQPIGEASLRALAQVPVDVRDARYREPLLRDAHTLRDVVGPRGEVVLLGSIASAKYTQVLLEVFGRRLLFPSAFVGRGDMSRGGLLLRCVRAGEELDYEPVEGAVLHGKRPPKLERIRRT